MNDIKVFNHFINPVDFEFIPGGVIGGRIAEPTNKKMMKQSTLIF